MGFLALEFLLDLLFEAISLFFLIRCAYSQVFRRFVIFKFHLSSHYNQHFSIRVKVFLKVFDLIFANCFL